MRSPILPWRLALGAWAWGNDGTFGGGLAPDDVRPVFDAARVHGPNLWDTAFAYGMGTSERTLAGFLADLPRESYLVSDKFTPQCADPHSDTPVADMIARQLELMRLDRFDIYWIHNPVGAPRYTEELARIFEGRDDAPVIGVSNHNLAEIRQADEILRAHGLRVGAVQNHFSLINRSSEDSGILAWCRENDAAFFSYHAGRCGGGGACARRLRVDPARCRIRPGFRRVGRIGGRADRLRPVPPRG